MATFDIFSKRQKRLRGEMPDVYVYDEFPDALKNQVTFIVTDALGLCHSHTYSRNAIGAYRAIIDVLCREWGKRELYPNAQGYHEHVQVFEALMREKDPERCLDIVELCMLVANTTGKDRNYRFGENPVPIIDACIVELNERFKENGLGYEFINNEIIRIDTQLIHSEVVKPAINFLNGEGFEGAQEEFFDAHACYRHGKYKDALNSANKSLESTMKVICLKRGWPFKKTDTAKKLINICIENGLFPAYYQSHLAALANLLEGGVPTIRNNEGGHGQGGETKTVEPHIASYTLHMTASAIVLLAKSHESL
ncbi:STM4504/CBY_0614 family protein [Pseudomonas putida]|uniref:STM4504/CBY_0614 family protein n=1 Tax=Pseudomonas putida TaxID=303 RepID=UPI00390647BC